MTEHAWLHELLGAIHRSSEEVIALVRSFEADLRRLEMRIAQLEMHAGLIMPAEARQERILEQSLKETVEFGQLDAIIGRLDALEARCQRIEMRLRDIDRAFPIPVAEYLPR